MSERPFTSSHPQSQPPLLRCVSYSADLLVAYPSSGYLISPLHSYRSPQLKMSASESRLKWASEKRAQYDTPFVDMLWFDFKHLSASGQKERGWHSKAVRQSNADRLVNANSPVPWEDKGVRFLEIDLQVCSRVGVLRVARSQLPRPARFLARGPDRGRLPPQRAGRPTDDDARARERDLRHCREVHS